MSTPFLKKMKLFFRGRDIVVLEHATGVLHKTLAQPFGLDHAHVGIYDRQHRQKLLDVVELAHVTVLAVPRLDEDAQLDGGKLVAQLDRGGVGELELDHAAIRAKEGQIVLPERDGDAYTYLVESAPNIDMRKSLFFALAQKGWALVGLEPLGMSLEDVFISIVDKTDGNAKKQTKGRRGRAADDTRDLAQSIIDSTAAALCMDAKLPVLVFGLDEPENIYRVIMGEHIGTDITC